MTASLGEINPGYCQSMPSKDLLIKPMSQFLYENTTQLGFSLGIMIALETASEYLTERIFYGWKRLSEDVYQVAALLCKGISRPYYNSLLSNMCPRILSGIKTGL